MIDTMPLEYQPNSLYPHHVLAPNTCSHKAHHISPPPLPNPITPLPITPPLPPLQPTLNLSHISPSSDCDMSTTALVLAKGSTLVQTHHDNKYPPILLDGDVFPADLHIWEQNVLRYFAKMEIADNRKVNSILSLFHALGISNWIENSRLALTADDYTFQKFMTDLHEEFLEPGWARKICRTEIKRTMNPDQRFIDYANCVVYYNIILKGMDQHSDDKQLHDTFTHHMSEGLITKIKSLPTEIHTRLDKIPTLNAWMRAVERIDQTWKAELKHATGMIKDFLNKH